MTVDIPFGQPITVGGLDGSVSLVAARTRSSRAAAYRLIHDSYVLTGILDPNPTGMRILPQDLDPRTTTFAAMHNERTVATVTLAPDGPLGLPMEAVYGDEVAGLRCRGRRLAEATGLAAGVWTPGDSLRILLGLTRLPACAAMHLGFDDLLVAAHPRQRRLYERILQFELFGPMRRYGRLRNSPALAFRLDLRDLARKRLICPRTFARYFGAAVSGFELLRPPSAADQAHFRWLLEWNCNPAAKSQERMA